MNETIPVIPAANVVSTSGVPPRLFKPLNTDSIPCENWSKPVIAPLNISELNTLVPMSTHVALYLFIIATYKPWLIPST